jgi:hypothetical protein
VSLPASIGRVRRLLPLHRHTESIVNQDPDSTPHKAWLLGQETAAPTRVILGRDLRVRGLSEERYG